MNLPMPTRRTVATLALALPFTLVVAACGSDAEPSADPTTTSSGSSYEVVPDAEVTSGLADIRDHAGTIGDLTASEDLEAAKAEYDELHEVWEAVEGTVKKNEPQTYLSIEDAMTAIKLGVQQNKPDQVTSGITDLDDSIDKYLAAHP